jgi:anti-sigma regulatory factor (Ser/Thr protein kinase)
MPARDQRELAALEQIVVADHPQRIERALETARDLLGMDVAYFSEFSEGDQVIRRVKGPGEAFGLIEGTRIPLGETYCARMVEGRIATFIPDTALEPAIADLDTQIGAYVGVPLHAANGRIFGTFCAASHDVRDDLGEHDGRLMRIVGQLLADALDRTAAVHPDAPIRPSEAPKPQVDRGDETARLTLWVVAAPKAVAASRRALEALAEHIEPELMRTLHLLVSELVTNSIRHSGIGPAQSVGIDVCVKPGHVRVGITDSGEGFDPADVPDPEPGQIGGWGLHIVDQMTQRWGVDSDGLTTVWFEIDLDRKQSPALAG